MKQLWAPWRMDYITSDEKRPDCIFCPGKTRPQDEERLILHVDSEVIIMMNRYPYVNGHVLVAPGRHVADPAGLDDRELLMLISTVRRVTEVLKTEMHPEGFNIGMNLGCAAGAGIEDHLHLHVVPRWSGDTNFMTVLGDVRVIPEHINKTYRRLLPYFAENQATTGRSE